MPISKKIQFKKLYIGLIIIAFLLVILIGIPYYHKYLNSVKPNLINTVVPSGINLVRTDTTNTGKEVVTVDTLFALNRSTSVDDFSRWSLLTSTNTELINTMSLIFAFSTFMIVIVGVAFYIELRKIEDSVEKQIENAVIKSKKTTRRVDKEFHDTCIEQLELMQNYWELIKSIVDILNESRNKYDLKILVKTEDNESTGFEEILKLLKRNVEALILKIKLHRSRIQLFDDDYSEIDIGISNLGSFEIDRIRDIEIIDYVLELWEDNPPHNIAENDMNFLVRRIRDLRKHIMDEARNKKNSSVS